MSSLGSIGCKLSRHCCCRLLTRPPALPSRAVLASAQALRAVEQGREARHARITEQLLAEGLLPYMFTCHSYISEGMGSEEAVAAARALGAEAAARAARQARIDELLAAEGLQRFAFLCAAYIRRGEGSEEEALGAAREAGQAEAAAAARREAVAAALQAEGIALDDDVELAVAVYRYIDLAAGTLEAGGWHA